MVKAKILRSVLVAAMLFLASIAAYSNSFHNAFHFDDSHTIVNNIYIRTIANIPLFFKDSTTFSSLPSNQSYRPVVSATLAIDYWLGKGLDDTFYFHLSMFILFVFQGILMVVFYRRIFDFADTRQGNLLTALLAAGWYVVHPANAETINYIISRSDTISAMLIVLCFILYGSSQVFRKWYLYLIPLALGMLTKPIAFIFPVLLLFYIFLFEKKASFAGLFRRRGLHMLLASFKKAAPSFMGMLVMLLVIKAMEPPTWTPGGASQFQYVITQPYVVLKYFTSFFLPVSLSADTDLAPFTSVVDYRFVIGTVFVAALLAAAVLTSAHARLRPVSFGIVWFFFTLLPTSIIPLAEVMNDHRVFLPYIGLMLSVCWLSFLLVDYCRRRFRYCSAVAAALIVAILSASAYGTYQRNKVWSTEETLWKDVTEKSPRNGRGLMNYGLALMARGDYAGAEKYFLKALELTPNYATLKINLGVLNDAMGRPSQAEEFFKNAIALQPGYPEGYFYYGRFLHRHDRPEEAEGNLAKALSLSPGSREARHLLTSLYLARGEENKARALARQTLAIAPDDEQALQILNTGGKPLSKAGIVAETPELHLNMSLAHYRVGKFERCIESAQQALQLRPGYDLAYNNICAAYCELKQWDKAIEAGLTAVRLNPGNQQAKNNLNWAQSGKAAAATGDSGTP